MKTSERLVTESAVESHLLRGVAAMQGLTIKVRFMRGWPDRIVLLPTGRIVFVELKRPVGGKFEPLQQRIHEKLRRMKFQVWVCYTKAQVDQLLGEYDEQED